MTTVAAEAFSGLALQPTASAGVASTLLCYLHACPICRSARITNYCRAPSLFHAQEFINYERCRTCDVVFRNPRLPDADRVKRYEDKPLAAQRAHLPFSQVHYFHILRVIRHLIGSQAKCRLLDFGSGAGGFLLEARDAGFDVMGLEVNRELARHVQQQHGIPIFCGLVDDPRFSGERFDAIVSSQVFEHLTDPRGTLDALKRHLKRPGLVLIEVPNLSHVHERLRRGSTMDDAHLFYFNRRSLSTLLQNAGFRVRRVQEGLRPYRWISDYGRSVPTTFVSAWERFFALCQIKTGLSILASLE